MATNVKSAYAMINGVKTVAVYSEETQLWTVETAAPADSSWSLPGHVYEVTLHAEDEAGNTVTMDSTDPEYGEQLKIRVLEKTAPTALITYPTDQSVLGSSNQLIKLQIKDAGGSGIDLSSVEFKVNDTDYSSSLEWSETEPKDGSYTAQYQSTGLSDGNNTVSLTVSDNDGNKSKTHTVTFVISTAAPTLSITQPMEGLVTNDKTITVSGTTTPGSSYVTVSKVTVNGDDATLEDGGTFSYEVTLTEGSNTIIIVATDSVGNTVTVRRTVVLDTKAPIITDVHAERTIVDAGATIKITFKVIEQ